MVQIDVNVIDGDVKISGGYTNGSVDVEFEIEDLEAMKIGMNSTDDETIIDAIIAEYGCQKIVDRLRVCVGESDIFEAMGDE